MDPSLKEELTQDGSMTITINIHNEICGIQKAGGAELDIEALLKCTNIAGIKATELTNLLQKRLQEVEDNPNVRKVIRKMKPIDVFGPIVVKEHSVIGAFASDLSSISSLSSSSSSSLSSKKTNKKKGGKKGMSIEEELKVAEGEREVVFSNSNSKKNKKEKKKTNKYMEVEEEEEDSDLDSDDGFGISKQQKDELSSAVAALQEDLDDM